MKQSKVLVSTLIAGGVFLVGAAIVLILSANSDKIQQNSAYIIPPATSKYPAPSLILTNLQEKSVALSDYLGQVVLVNNWAIWCPPCKLEMPELQAYYQAHAEDGFVLIGIESGEPPDQVAAFAKTYGLTFPVWIDLHAAALEAFQNWSLPSSYVINTDGTIVYSWTGQINQKTLERYVTPLLNR
jgi:peroxiredoxin